MDALLPLVPPAAAVRARLKVDDDDLVWNEDPRAWHQQSARTVLHRFSTFQNFQQFARESKQAGVSMLMLMRVRLIMHIEHGLNNDFDGGCCSFMLRVHVLLIFFIHPF